MPADAFILTKSPSDPRGPKLANFESGVDTLVIDALDFGAGLDAGALDPSAFRANRRGVAKDADDRFLYNIENGKLFFDADGSGPGQAVQIARLAGAPAIDADDFLITGDDIEGAPGGLVAAFLTGDVHVMLFVSLAGKTGEAIHEFFVIA